MRTFRDAAVILRTQDLGEADRIASPGSSRVRHGKAC
nr:recombination protein O N-terminal domain-containing protein [Mobiluncus sp. Marseille-Q7826]